MTHRRSKIVLTLLAFALSVQYSLAETAEHAEVRGLTPEFQQTLPEPEPESTAVPPNGPTSLTLEEAVSTALSRNPTVKATQAAVKAADYRVDQAGAAYYPTLDLSNNFTHTDTSQGSGGVVSNGLLLSNSGGSNNTRDVLSSSISARATLFDGTREPNFRRAKESLTAVEFDAEETAQELILQVRTLYFQTLLDQELAAIQKQRVENIQLRLNQAQGFYEAGTAARNEVTQAAADLANAQLEATRADATLELDWVRLNVLLGTPSQNSYQLTQEEAENVPSLSMEEFMKVALDERPELQSGWARIRAQLAQVDANSAARWPTLSASAGYNLNGQPTPLDRTWSAGLILSWSLFDGGLNRARAEEAKATAEQLTEQLESTSNTVYQEIAVALTAWRTAETQQTTAQAGLDAAEQNRFLAAERYRVGVGNFLELSDAELALTEARTNVARAANATRTAAAQLARAVGVVEIAEVSLENQP